MTAIWRQFVKLMLIPYNFLAWIVKVTIIFPLKWLFKLPFKILMWIIIPIGIILILVLVLMFYIPHWGLAYN